MNSTDPHPDDRRPLGASGASLALLTVALWGANPVAVSYSVDVLPPVAVAAVRFSLATAVMLLWCRVEGSPLWLRGRQWTAAGVAGLLLFAQIATFNVGVQLSNSSHTSLLINTFAFWVLAIEHITGGDRLTGSKLCGLLLAAVGVLLIFATDPKAEAAPGQDAPTLGGDSITLVSAAILGVKIIYTKHALRSVPSGSLILWHNAVGVALFWAVSGLCETADWSRLTPPAAWALLYQGLVVAGLCFAIQARLLRRHSATSIAVFGFATPVFGVLFAMLLRHDPISPWLFVSLVLVASGILLVNLRRA